LPRVAVWILKPTLRIRLTGSGFVGWGLALEDRSTRRRGGWGAGFRVWGEGVGSGIMVKG